MGNLEPKCTHQSSVAGLIYSSSQNCDIGILKLLWKSVLILHIHKLSHVEIAMNHWNKYDIQFDRSNIFTINVQNIMMYTLDICNFTCLYHQCWQLETIFSISIHYISLSWYVSVNVWSKRKHQKRGVIDTPSSLFQSFVLPFY